MPRNMSEAYRAAVTAPGVRTAYMITLEYPDGTVRLTDYAHDLEDDGFTYIATGELMSISTVTETSDVEISTLLIEISALAPGFIAAFLLYDHINRPVTLYRAVLDVNSQLIDKITLFAGMSSDGGIQDAGPGGVPLIQLEASSHFGDLDQKAGRYTNDASQKDRFPGDKGFDHVDDLVDPLIWGRPDRV